MEGKLVFIAFFIAFGQNCALELRNGAYEGFVIKIEEDVPTADCKSILENIETTLTSASQYLFSALDGRAYIRSATVLLPPTWPDACIKQSQSISGGAGEQSDLTVLAQDSGRGRIFTQQSLGCGQNGDQMFIVSKNLNTYDASLARTFVKNFAMYRYGVFEEQGYLNDPIYPMCFLDDDGEAQEAKVTGCSDLPIHDNGICKSVGNTVYNTSKMVDERARTSIMFAAESPNISMFCEDGNHDKFAPTKHNSICQRRSVFDVIMSHKDFLVSSSPSADFPELSTNLITNTTPRLTFKRQKLTRYVFLIENTKDMMQRESWSYLRRAIRYWTLNILPENTEIGLVLVEEQSKKILDLASTSENRDKFHSAIPYTPGDSLQAACIHCGLKDAMDMLNERTKLFGSAQNVIVVISSGMNPSDQLDKVVNEIKQKQIKIAALTYPTLLRAQLLNRLAEETNGAAYTIFEKKLNVDTTFLTTYFELNNVLIDITQKFYSGSASNLPIEIHRREFLDDGRPSITGSFMLDPNLGQPSQFAFFTHNSETPLIKSLKLISPTHEVFATRNDRYIDYKLIFLTANISEPGTWTYTVEPYQGSVHPHYLQITATPLKKGPIVRAKFWTHRDTPHSPLILLVEVKRGDLPVMGAKVEVVVTKMELNGSVHETGRMDLFDNGAGDPDITKGDGVYTRYFNLASQNAAGLYNFDVTVSDNGNTAYYAAVDEAKEPCCGSVIPARGARTPIAPFQRVLPRKTVMITSEELENGMEEAAVGRIGDLRVEMLPADEMKARLVWTAPDMGGRQVTHYEIRYARRIEDVVEGFEGNSSRLWENGRPLPFAPGSETTFHLDFAQAIDLWDKAQFFAIKAYARGGRDVSGPVSNWVRVLIASPPPPSTIPPNYQSNDKGFWPHNGGNSVGIENVGSGPSLAKSLYGLELILPIVIGIILLIVLLILYCYFCVVKRRTNGQNHKKSSDSINKNDKLSSTITIVPSSPQNFAQTNYGSDLLPDPHQIGVPVTSYVDYEEETKKRYSLVNQQEQQLIEELKQQQQMQQQQGARDQYVSVISNGSLGGGRGGHTLSPFNSWSASQLLHEHERRHSPMENMDEMMAAQDLLINQNEHLIDHYGHGHHVPPPVPPLPAFNNGGYPINYNIYGVHGAAGTPTSVGNNGIYQSMQRQQQSNQQQQTDQQNVVFNPSLQGSLSSVNSGDKKRRNVTMV